MTSFQISHWKPINQEMRGSITFFRHLHLFRPQFAPRLRPTQHFSVCADASQSTVASGESYDANQAAANDFYARENLTFEQLGFHERLCSSLKAAGFTQTAYVQVSAGYFALIYLCCVYRPTTAVCPLIIIKKWLTRIPL